MSSLKPTLCQRGDVTPSVYLFEKRIIIKSNLLCRLYYVSLYYPCLYNIYIYIDIYMVFLLFSCTEFINFFVFFVYYIKILWKSCMAAFFYVLKNLCIQWMYLYLCKNQVGEYSLYCVYNSAESKDVFWYSAINTLPFTCPMTKLISD